MLDVVQRYDIDGINLDYVRTGGLCVSIQCQLSYQYKSSRNLLRDIETIRASPDARRAIIEWNVSAVSVIVESFSKRARTLKPSIIISVDSLVGDDGDWLEQGVDNITWANSQWIDVIFHMDYNGELKENYIRKGGGRLIKPQALVILVGNFYWSDPVKSEKPMARPASLVTDLIRSARRVWPHSGGVAIYSYTYLTDDQIGELHDGPFRIGGNSVVGQ